MPWSCSYRNPRRGAVPTQGKEKQAAPLKGKIFYLSPLGGGRNIILRREKRRTHLLSVWKKKRRKSQSPEGKKNQFLLKKNERRRWCRSCEGRKKRGNFLVGAGFRKELVRAFRLREKEMLPGLERKRGREKRGCSPAACSKWKKEGGAIESLKRKGKGRGRIRLLNIQVNRKKREGLALIYPSHEERTRSLPRTLQEGGGKKGFFCREEGSCPTT